MRKIIYPLFLMFIFISCTTSFKSEKEFYQWINDADNGFVKHQQANGFKLEVKYLPATYLAYLELNKDLDPPTQQKYNQLVEEFKTSKTFTLTIEHENAKVDPTFYNVWDMPEYKERIQQLNFNMSENIYIRTASGKLISPALASMENVYQISNKKTLYLVFPDSDNQLSTSETLDFVFEDTFLETGINHFQFQTKALAQLPKFHFIPYGDH